MSDAPTDRSGLEAQDRELRLRDGRTVYVTDREWEALSEAVTAFAKTWSELSEETKQAVRAVAAIMPEGQETR